MKLLGNSEVFKPINLNENLHNLQHSITNYENPMFLQFQEHSNLKFGIEYYMQNKRLVSETFVGDLIVRKYKHIFEFTIAELGDVSYMLIDNKDIKQFEKLALYFV